MTLTTLFLDAGGVLVHPSWPRVSEVLARHGVRTDAAALAAAEPPAKRQMDRPAIINNTDDRARGWVYFNNVLTHAGIGLSAATEAALAELRDYHHTENLWEQVPPDVPGALARFRALGLRLVVVSNANGRLRYLFDRVDLSRHFDVVLDSHEWGVEKPDPRLFHIALEQAGADPARTIHVGDLYHVDVAGARAAGLADAVLLDVADLYGDADCPRVRTLDELATRLASGSWREVGAR